MESDTIRQDWLIFIIGLLACGWFFFDYGNHHPLKFADASLGKQTVVEYGSEQLQSLGHPLAEASYLATFKTHGRLLDDIQQQSDTGTILADSIEAKAFSPFYWNLNIFYPEDMESRHADLEQRGLGSFEQRGLDNFEQREIIDLISITITFNQQGEWMEFRNPANRLPARLSSKSVLQSVGILTDSLPAGTMNNSIARSSFRFSFGNDPVRAGQTDNTDNDVQIIDLEDAEKIAGYYLGQTSWPVNELQLTSGSVVPFNDIEAAELIYQYQSELIARELRLRVVLSPAGVLLAMEADYPGIGNEAPDASIITGNIRSFLLIIFSFWLFILLYMRVRSGVVDLSSAILMAVFAGLAVPVILLFQWFYEQMHLPGSPGIFDIVILFFTTGFSAALVSLVFFVVSVLGESISRQNRIEKIRTMDLLRMGHFFNRPTGTVCIHAVSFGLILSAVWSMFMWYLPGTYIQIEDTFFSDTTFFAPLVRILMFFLLCFLTIQAIFLVLAEHLKSWNRSGVLTVITATVIFSVVVPVPINSGPLFAEMILNGVTGLALGLIYVYRDFLTTFLSYFIFVLLLATADGWLMEQSPDLLVFYPSAGIAVVLLVIGFISISRGKRAYELPSYVPEYIDDLAQDERIRQELQIARKVQQSFLPVKKPDVQGIDISAMCIPAYETGGDYYDFIELGNRQLAITVGDVSGKGFQAAFYMTFIKGVLHALCQDYDSTVTILKKANKLFRENAHRGTFISMIFGIIDLHSRKFIFSRAGHNPLLYYRACDNRLEVVRPDGLALGMTGGSGFNDHIAESEINLQSGDILVLYTDGIVEAMNWKGEFYGEQRLQRMVFFHQGKSAREIVKYILRDVKKFTDKAEQHDDMTLLVMKTE